ncbi:uncharacterized protein LOC123562279 [Mercenaria mercenaria]|uniref:uncharacterized protein LOC123562279 n=1 Tax=Mercenaria mercenaria TaxID=6596 RepID=UPI00234ED6D2|nr:uncharacterized protein LOC123562279 [Mercenaria mercenaria]
MQKENNEETMLTRHQDERSDWSIQNAAAASEQLDTSKKFEDLTARMERLEAREKAREQKYVNEIQNLRRQLSIQSRRTSSLERLVNRLWNKRFNHKNQGMDKHENTSKDLEERIKSPTLHSRDVKRSQRIRRGENNSQVAFFAVLTQHLTQVGAISQLFSIMWKQISATLTIVILVLSNPFYGLPL